VAFGSVVIDMGISKLSWISRQRTGAAALSVRYQRSPDAGFETSPDGGHEWAREGRRERQAPRSGAERGCRYY
jgi:hypothetical protein